MRVFEDRFYDIVGVTFHKDNPVENILLWVDESGYPYVHTKPLRGSQSIVKGAADRPLREKYPALQSGCFFRLKCILNYELEQLLMLKMDQLVVLEPAILTDNLKNRIKKLDSLYSSI